MTVSWREFSLIGLTENRLGGVRTKVIGSLSSDPNESVLSFCLTSGRRLRGKHISFDMMPTFSSARFGPRPQFISSGAGQELAAVLLPRRHEEQHSNEDTIRTGPWGAPQAVPPEISHDFHLTRQLSELPKYCQPDSTEAGRRA
ncbi:unnamed protein product [Protopolystoma xenopodis]|uniref:Uncharacterized protein n=1 Tax=Protopolystoma xenopodis TaxID=117903 RepID=A0A3S5FCP0_9PLAT|nr:unnamed protein product [Protopolystoma xenopodis]